MTGHRLAVVNVFFTGDAVKPEHAFAAEAVDAVNAGTAVETWPTGALVVASQTQTGKVDPAYEVEVPGAQGPELWENLPFESSNVEWGV